MYNSELHKHTIFQEVTSLVNDLSIGRETIIFTNADASGGGVSMSNFGQGKRGDQNGHKFVKVFYFY